jgi:hypothetical protein
MTVRELRDLCGCRRLTARARDAIEQALRDAELALEPPLADRPLSARVTVVDRRVFAARPEPPASVLRVAPWLAEVEPGPPRGRLAPRRSAVLGGLLGGLVVAVLAFALGTGGGEGTSWDAVAGTGPAVALPAAEIAVAAGAAGDASLDGRYAAAAALGRGGRYLEARAAMLALGGHRRSEAAARSFSVRAAQAMLAEARRVHARRPAGARALVRRAARIAPGLSSLPRMRALVARRP